MIVEYHRPETLQSALDLLSRINPRTVPLGGGTHLSHYQGEPIAVVDLRKLNLSKIERTGNLFRIGAAVTLQELVDSDKTPSMIKETVRFETNYNLRQSATAAGTLVTGDGKSAFISALLAVDARVSLQPGGQTGTVGDWLNRRSTRNESVLITEIELPLDVILKYEFVGRSQQDLPIISVAVAEWPGGRTRIVVGGFGAFPVLAMDGANLSTVETSIKNACSQLSNNNNFKFILETSNTLTRRLLEK